MIFKAEPNLYVRLASKHVQRATGKKGFSFDENGLYITDNESMIKALSQTFETVEAIPLTPVKEEPLPFEDVDEIIEDEEELEIDRTDDEIEVVEGEVEIKKIPVKRKVEVKKTVNKKRR